MAMDPATAKLMAELSIKLVKDEEFRKKILIFTITPVAVLIMIIALPFYLLTHPLESFGLVNAQEISLVENFQNEYGYYGDDANIDISGDYSNSEIPLFLQYDRRWGMFNYGRSGTISSSGCGPTSLAMIIVGLTGDLSVNPKVIADWSYTNGYRVEGVGSSWSLFSAGATNWNIECTEIPVTATAISNALREVKPLIISMGAGHFTNSGHFIVLRGITESGKILVNDPNSSERSQMEWSSQIIVNEAKGAWCFNEKS
jgi:hypothetical protein